MLQSYHRVVGVSRCCRPPSTVFASYNHYAGPKEIRVWNFNKHEGGETFQVNEQLRWLRELFKG
jgi:cephalosporin-C deacetylase